MRGQDLIFFSFLVLLVLFRIVDLFERVRHEGSKHSVPQHDVLTIITPILSMVEVMRIDVVHERNADIVPRVVEASHRAPDEDKQQEGNSMERADGKDACCDEDSPQVVVLAGDVLKWVHVDRIIVTPKRRHLPVVVLVDIAVQRRPVKCPVEQCVKEVVHDKQKRQMDWQHE